MSFASVVVACWLGIAAVAFLALSGLGRLAARGDVEADLGIVGDAELRMLVGGRGGERASLELRIAELGMPSACASWAHVGSESRS
jgi:hypothetical protein